MIAAIVISSFFLSSCNSESLILFSNFIIGMMIMITILVVQFFMRNMFYYYQQICQGKCSISWQINFELSFERTKSYDIICDAYQISVAFGECKCTFIWLIQLSAVTSTVSACTENGPPYAVRLHAKESLIWIIMLVCVASSDMWKRAYL